MRNLPNHLMKAGDEVGATYTELDASIALYRAALLRDDRDGIKRAEQACHGALQRHLDAQMDLIRAARTASGQ